MATVAVDDLWYLAKRGLDGERLKSKRYGRGKRWQVRYVDDNGKEHRPLFDKQKAAELFDANVRADVSRGQYVDPAAGRLTVAELAEQWRAASLHTDSTTVRVEHAIRLHINPILGGRQVGKVRSGQIQGWVKDRSAVLAPTTLRVVFSYLVSMFAMAARDKMGISASPCVGIHLPEVDGVGRFIPRPEQVHRLAELVDMRYTAMVYLAAGCGLRLGEVLGLERADVDFLRREVHVRRQLKALTGRKPFLGPVKTKTSRRTVELPEVVAVALARHMEGGLTTVEIDDETDPRRPRRREAELFFTSARGEPVAKPTFSRNWRPAADTVGLPARWGFHGLRHYFATLLIHAGASVKTVQLALGHSTPTITLNTYAHEWPDAIDRTRSLVDNALGKQPAAALSVVSRA